jgi:phosphoribosylamine--glycine ligase
MMTSQGPRVLEFNCRFGDPEAQAVLPRLDTDLLDILESTLSGSLSGFSIRWNSKPSVCVVLSSGGYPEKNESGKVISGIPQAAQEAGVTVFHSATLMKDGKLLTDGGRVLGVTALGDDLEEAIRRAYRAVGHIRFEGMQYRKDIGARALGR